MKKFFFALLATLSVFVAHAQYFTLAAVTTGGTPLTLTTNSIIVDNILVQATTSNITTAKFYDSEGTTNIVTPAYTSYIQYSTNITQVTTNQLGYVYTNTFAGLFTAPMTNSAATNQLGAVAVFVIPASGSVTRDTRIQTVQGLTVLTDQNASVVVSYRKTN